MAATVAYGKDTQGKFTGVVTITLDNNERKLVKQAHDDRLVRDEETGAVVGGQAKAARAGREQLMSLLQNALAVEADRASKSAADYDREIQRIQAEKAANAGVDVGTIG